MEEGLERGLSVKVLAAKSEFKAWDSELEEKN